MFFAVVTFGTSPSKTVFTSLARAEAVAQQAVGIGSCTEARVYACETRKLARTADIGVVRNGEQIAENE